MVVPLQGFWNLTIKLLPTIDSECDAALSCKGIICDGDLHIIRSIIRESQVVEKQSPILKYQDAVSVLRPQGPNDVSSNWLDNSDRLFPLELPLDDRQVRAETTVVDWQQGLSSHSTSDESVGDGHIYCQHTTCRETQVPISGYHTSIFISHQSFHTFVASLQ